MCRALLNAEQEQTSRRGGRRREPFCGVIRKDPMDEVKRGDGHISVGVVEREDISRRESGMSQRQGDVTLQ